MAWLFAFGAALVGVVSIGAAAYFMLMSFMVPYGRGNSPAEHREAMAVSICLAVVGVMLLVSAGRIAP